MDEKKRFVVTAEVTVSLRKEIDAFSIAEAMEHAAGLGTPRLCWQCSGDQGDDAWELSGELDGEPMNIQLED